MMAGTDINFQQIEVFLHFVSLGEVGKQILICISNKVCPIF